MSNRVFKSDLSTEGLTNMINELKRYAEVDLPTMADHLVRRLAEEGIKVAEVTVHPTFKNCIEFRYDTQSLGMGELVATDITLIHRVWYTSDNPKIRKQKDAWISPLLMSEFGAGPEAIEGHRGTFPGQHNAFRSSWRWYDAAGNKYSSTNDTAMRPTQPMYRAMVEMMNNVDKIAREVFGANYV